MERLIDKDSEKEIKIKFEAGLKGDIDVLLFTSDIMDPKLPQIKEINDFTREFITELSGIDGRIKLTEKTLSSPEGLELEVKTSPTIFIGKAKGYNIEYNGAPLGHEASSFIETLCHASAGVTDLEEGLKKLLAAVDRKTKIQVFVTPTCPYCPKQVVLANKIAIETKGMVYSECVESLENQSLATVYNVSSVQQQVINGDFDSVSVGVQPDKAFVMQLLKYGAPEKYHELMDGILRERAEKEKLAENPIGTIYLSDGNFDKAVKKYDKILVDCWAEWCAPCRILSPVIEELAKESAGKIVFGMLNIDENPETSGKYEVKSIPTILVFRNGEKAGEIVGVHPKEQLNGRINELMGM
jgi:thioredoxin reductase (NADPH)